MPIGFAWRLGRPDVVLLVAADRKLIQVVRADPPAVQRPYRRRSLGTGARRNDADANAFRQLCRGHGSCFQHIPDQLGSQSLFSTLRLCWKVGQQLALSPSDRRYCR